jgi:hypothetical protein
MTKLKREKRMAWIEVRKPNNKKLYIPHITTPFLALHALSNHQKKI